MKIELGEPLSIGMRARANLGGTFEFEVPKFGSPCVCCESETGVQPRAYDPTADRTRAPSFPVPVCGSCEPHALRSPSVRTWQRALVWVGAGSIAAPLVFRGRHLHGMMRTAPIVLGAAAIVAVIVWVVAAALHARRMRTRGHHIGLTVSVEHGVTAISTTNPTLVQRLLARHRSARLVGARVPRARVIERDDEA